MFTPRDTESVVVRSLDRELMQRQLADLLTSVRGGELTPSDFTVRLESLHARFLGEAANTPDMVERRRVASKAYDDLTLGIDRHHDLERLAEALGIDPP